MRGTKILQGRDTKVTMHFLSPRSLQFLSLQMFLNAPLAVVSIVYKNVNVDFLFSHCTSLFDIRPRIFSLNLECISLLHMLNTLSAI